MSAAVPDLPPVGDPFRFTCIGHRGHGLCSPLHMGKLERLLTLLERELGLAPGDHVLDLAGGKGLFARAVAERSGASATVVDANPWFLAEGRAALADELASPGLAADLDELVFAARRADELTVEFVHGDVAEVVATGDLDGRGEPTASGGQARPAKLVACVGARPWEDRRATLAALVELTAPGGAVLVGEGYWRSAPDEGLVELLGGMQSAELDTTFDDHPRLAAELGLELAWSHAATPAEFDTYDRRFVEALTAWCTAHPTDPDAAGFLDRITTWDRHMTRCGRATMGFGWYLYHRA